MRSFISSQSLMLEFRIVNKKKRKRKSARCGIEVPIPLFQCTTMMTTGSTVSLRHFRCALKTAKKNESPLVCLRGLMCSNCNTVIDCIIALLSHSPNLTALHLPDFLQTNATVALTSTFVLTPKLQQLHLCIDDERLTQNLLETLHSCVGTRGIKTSGI